MAKGSEKFSWKLYPGSERKCWECDRELRVKDVAEERTVYPGRRYQFRCTTCKERSVAESIKRTRAMLGLDKESA